MPQILPYFLGQTFRINKLFKMNKKALPSIVVFGSLVDYLKQSSFEKLVGLNFVSKVVGDQDCVLNFKIDESILESEGFPEHLCILGSLKIS